MKGMAALIPVLLVMCAPDVCAEGVKEPISALPDRGLCAHRGDMDKCPENTLAAFRQAISVGSPMVEFDVWMTRDKRLVVVHDAAVDRTTNGKGKVSDLTLAQIRRLNAGLWKSPQFAGERVPTLDEVLKLMPGNIWLNVHLKGGDELGRAVAETIKKTGRLHQAFLACDVDAAEGARKAVPAVMICRMGPRSDSQSYVEAAVSQKARFVQLAGAIDDELAKSVRYAKKHGLKVNYFGVKTTEDVEALFAMGVDFPLVNNVSELIPRFPTRVSCTQR